MLLLLALGGCLPPADKAPSAQEIQAALDATARQADADLCAREIGAKRQQYRVLMGQREYWAAARWLAPCHQFSATYADLPQMIKSAEVLEYSSVVQNTKKKATERASALNALQRDYPESAVQFQALGPMLEKASAKETAFAQAKADQAARASLRREGVRIGMTQQEVLMSSWGKPERVNTTTRASGVRQQWVYAGGYLYFEDGILTTIQN